MLFFFFFYVGSCISLLDYRYSPCARHKSGRINDIRIIVNEREGNIHPNILYISNIAAIIGELYASNENRIE